MMSSWLSRVYGLSHFFMGITTLVRDDHVIVGILSGVHLMTRSFGLLGGNAALPSQTLPRRLYVPRLVFWLLSLEMMVLIARCGDECNSPEMLVRLSLFPPSGVIKRHGIGGLCRETIEERTCCRAVGKRKACF